jgi:hypothetical protein
MANGKGQMEEMAGKTTDIPTRAFEFGVRIIKLCQHLDAKPGVSRTLASQLLRAGTSIGANVEEGPVRFLPLGDVNDLLSICHFPFTICHHRTP